MLQTNATRAPIQHIMQNPSVYLHGPGDAQIADAPMPTLQHPSDANSVIVRIAYVGVCGSDVHFYSNGGINKNDLVQPLIMGHEASGTVCEIGSQVQHLKLGDHVALEPGIPCRSCTQCKRGSYNLCPSMRFAAAPPDTHGCLSQFYKLPADLCYLLPEGVGLREGVLVEPLAVGAHAARMVGVRPGDRVVVMGAGTVGLCSAMVAKWFGAAEVVLVDLVETKLKFAKNMLGCSTFRATVGVEPEEMARKLVQQVGSQQFDAVIEATGAQACVQMGVYALRKGGHFVQTGLGKAMIEFPIVAVSEKELHVHGAFRYGPDDFSIALQVVGSKNWEVATLISTDFPFEDTTQAWMATRDGQGIKNLIRVGGDRP
jgi:D-xylulose reductase